MSGPFEAQRYDLGSGAGLYVAVLDDAVALMALGHRFAAIEPWSRYGFSGDALGTFLARTEAHKKRFGIYCDETLAGLVIVQPGWLRGPYVPFFGVLPEFQRRGLGGKVLGWIAAEAALSGERNTWIAVSDFNQRARALYERHGYIAVAEIPGLVIDERTELIMRKRL